MKALTTLLLITAGITLPIEILTLAAIWSVGRSEELREHEWGNKHEKQRRLSGPDSN